MKSRGLRDIVTGTHDCTRPRWLGTTSTTGGRSRRGSPARWTATPAVGGGAIQTPVLVYFIVIIYAKYIKRRLDDFNVRASRRVELGALGKPGLGR